MVPAGPAPPVAWPEARRILGIRLDAVGDVLMTTPALRALGAGRPDRRVTLLTSSPASVVTALLPDVHDVVVYDAPWMKATPPRASSAGEYAMAERLRAGRFDAAVVFTVYSQNPMPGAFLAWLAGIPLRLAHCRENPYQMLTDWVPDPEPERIVRHEVRRQLDLVGAVGCATDDERLALRVPDPARRAVARLLRELGLERRAWVLLHPGASAPSRRYPPEAFARAARRLGEVAGCDVVLTGTAEERALVETVRRAAGPRAHGVAGRLSFAEFAALVERAPLLIGNNSGPIHVAAAVGTPVVDLYALTNPQHTPWGVPHRVLSHDVPCKFCYKSVCPEGHGNCLRLVSPDTVVEAAVQLLGARESAPAAAE
jgi:lipopolysaccharide heptosyltransferase II